MTVRVVVEFDEGSGPPQGRVAADDGEPRPFAGLLELLAMLDALLLASRARPG